MDSESFLEMSRFEKNHWWFCGRRKIIDLFLKKIKLKKNAEILEIGCGTGSNLNMLKSYGFVSAIEPSEEAIHYLKKKDLTAVNFSKGKCPEDLDFENKFDLICMFDVLEHIDEDSETLSKTIKSLKNNGRLFITVPAYQWLWSQHDINLMHKRRYNSNTLKNLIKNFDIKIEHITHFNTILFPLALLDRVIKKIIKNNNKNNKFPNYFLNSLFKIIFNFEKILLKFFYLPFGLSLLLIIKKA